MSNDSWDEMIKDNMSDLKISYYTYSFENNKSIYKFDRWSPKPEYTKQQKKRQTKKTLGILIYYKQNEHAKQIVGTNFVVEDSIPNIQWKLTNEHREIAVYNCRKAVIYDDVYVFAFYTDDIIILAVHAL
jgi:GLPGLI family protein